MSAQDTTAPAGTDVKYYECTPHRVEVVIDGKPFVLRVRLLWREDGTVRAVRSLRLFGANGERLETVDVGKIANLDDLTPWNGVG